MIIHDVVEMRTVKNLLEHMVLEIGFIQNMLLCSVSSSRLLYYWLTHLFSFLLFYNLFSIHHEIHLEKAFAVIPSSHKYYWEVELFVQEVELSPSHWLKDVVALRVSVQDNPTRLLT